MTTEPTEAPAAPAARTQRTWIGRTVATVLVVIAASIAGFAISLPNRDEKLPEPQAVPVNVTTWTVKPIPQLPDTLDVTAVIEPQAIVRVAAEVAGRIERFGERQDDVTWRGETFLAGETLEEGEPINAGDPLIHLNDDLLQARFDRAKAQFAYDEREYRRLLDLYERGSTSKSELDDARTRRDISRANMDEAARELERTTVFAPSDGILNRLPMEIGEYAMPGQIVAEIVNITQVKVAVDVPERDVHFMSLGDTTEVFSRMPEERRFTGEISYISETADELTRTTRLEITVDNPDDRLRSGQIVQVRLTRRMLTDVIMIPLAAVIPLEVGRVVYIVDDQGQAQRVEVELGFVRGRSVRVLSGLEPGQSLIVVGHRYVGPGQPVKIIEQLDASALEL